MPASCIASARAMTRRTPSSNPRAPVAVSAVYSPRLWPAQKLGLDAEALDRVEDHQAGHERGELGVARVLELVGVGVEQQPGDVAPVDLAGDRAGLLDQLPALVVGATAGPSRVAATPGRGT